MSGKARRRPSWKKTRGRYFDSKYYLVSYDKFAKVSMNVMPKSIAKDILDYVLVEDGNSNNA